MEIETVMSRTGSALCLMKTVLASAFFSEGTAASLALRSAETFGSLALALSALTASVLAAPVFGVSALGESGGLSLLLVSAFVLPDLVSAYF